MTSSVGAWENGHKITCTKSLYLSVKSSENLRSIRLQISPQVSLISVRCQKNHSLEAGSGLPF